MRNEGFHAKELKACLRAQLTKIVEHAGLPGFEDAKAVDRLLNTLLIRDHGAILRDAQRKALADHAQLEPAGELPEIFPTEETCAPSLRNVYGIYPPGLNLWERAFAETLDSSSATTVQWWHRNPVKQPHSVAMVRADGRHFYPDFVIGVEGRKTEDGVLLADPKAMFEDSAQAPKIHALHPCYGRAMIVFKTGQFGWHPVVWDETAQKAKLGPELDWQKAPIW